MSVEQVRYGSGRHRVGDLFVPETLARAAPVVVLIHGGFWRSVFTRRSLEPLARALVERNLLVFNIEYRRTGPRGGGGGWPTTFADIRAAIDHVASFEQADLTRVIAVGHSAGGQLALWAGAHVPLDRVLDEQPHVRLRGVISLAGVVDLVRAADLGLGYNAVARFLGGSPTQVPQRYAAASPSSLVPIGVSQVIIHGLSDTVIPPSMGEDYARLASAAGDRATCVGLPGSGHHDVIVPTGSPFAALVEAIGQLLGSS